MGSEVSRSNTHVANATGMPIWIAYSTDKMRLVKRDVATSAGLKVSCAFKNKMVTGDADLSSSINMNETYVNDSRVRVHRLPAADYCKFAGEGTIYASVFLQTCECCEDNLKKISENYHVPSDRSFIVTRNHNIKFQKYGAGIWVDDLEYDHTPA